MMMDNTAEAEYTRAKTSVWWDIENCAVPKGYDAHGITQKLTTALANMNYCGPLSISSYGNTDLIPKAVQQALSSTGISLNHVPSGRKDASDKKILVDMFLWVVENPPPANIMLISGDIDFSDALHRLRMRRYNILLAHPQRTSPYLVASAKTSWLWRSLLLASGSSLTQCESSGVLESSEVSSEDVSESTQPMDSGSGSSRSARSKLKGIYVPKAPNELLVKETNRKKLQKKCSETKNVEESVQENDQESLKGLEKQNKELMETIETSERNVAPLHVDHVFSELSRDFPVPKEVRESFDAIPMKLEPTQNEIVIEELEGMLKQILQIKPGELENEPVGLSENLKEDMNKKKKKRNKKKSRVIEEDKAEPYVCSICSVICDSPAMFESHLNGRKHAATIEKHAEALLGDKQIPDDVIQYNGHLIDGEASENIDYFEDVPEIDYKSFPNEEAREWIDAIFNTPELSQDANLTREFESILNQSLEMNSGGYEGVTEHPEEFKDKVSKDKSESEAYVCSICSVVCACPTVFESHLMGRRHAAKVKKHAEVLFDDKKILEESLKEKDHPEDSMVKRLEVSLEDTSKQTVVEAGSASELVDVTCSSQIDFNSHLTGKKHAATVKKYEPVVKKEGAVVKKQAGTKFAYVRKNGP
ncbi:PREDICTED: uncharacterized protein LOC106327752 isoform X2 [Brassica oleracea var. oleracea]|uniref:C2H2-type domain-containing protein n=1 Tax=Brassica oleracea var. oleracea TaxID=109376 RepID=A0A0D3AY56_BRAOL|nr:PREDICTED: uncharacterized protein LOC106327752 isoform X2 [Brassica oleracea var. oleracea]